MNKKFIMINGPMGVGKTSICRKLNKVIEKSIWLDGDWCWMMNPFLVTENGKKMVVDNISYLLNNFLKNPEHDVIIFCWVIPEMEIYQRIIEQIDFSNFDLTWLTLDCSEDELYSRLVNDLRDASTISRSLEYKKKYFKDLSSDVINTTYLTVSEVVDFIIKKVFDDCKS